MATQNKMSGLTNKYLTQYAAGALLVAFGGCATGTTSYSPTTGRMEDRPISFPRVVEIDQDAPLEVQQKQRENVAAGIVQILRNEFDKVYYMPLEHGGKTDLVIRGYETRDNLDWPACGFNVDNVCDEYLQGRPFFKYLVGQDTFIFPSTGEVVRCNGLSTSAAEQLDYVMTKYIEYNNKKRCESFWVMMKLYTTPAGPVSTK